MSSTDLFARLFLDQKSVNLSINQLNPGKTIMSYPIGREEYSIYSATIYGATVVELLQYLFPFPSGNSTVPAGTVTII